MATCHNELHSGTSLLDITLRVISIRQCPSIEELGVASVVDPLHGLLLSLGHTPFLIELMRHLRTTIVDI